jgi:hypothetical protein
MLPNLYTAITLCEFEHQERLRAAAHERLAASAERSGPSMFAHIRTAPHVAAPWLSRQMRRLAARSGHASHLPWPAIRRWRADRRVMRTV